MLTTADWIEILRSTLPEDIPITLIFILFFAWIFWSLGRKPDLAELIDDKWLRMANELSTKIDMPGLRLFVYRSKEIKCTYKRNRIYLSTAIVDTQSDETIKALVAMEIAPMQLNLLTRENFVGYVVFPVGFASVFPLEAILLHSAEMRHDPRSLSEAAYQASICIACFAPMILSTIGVMQLLGYKTRVSDRFAADMFKSVDPVIAAILDISALRTNVDTSEVAKVIDRRIKALVDYAKKRDWNVKTPDSDINRFAINTVTDKPDRYYDLSQDLAARASIKIPPPKIRDIPLVFSFRAESPILTAAILTGLSTKQIALTTGLINALDEDELSAGMAIQISQAKVYAKWLSTALLLFSFLLFTVAAVGIVLLPESNATWATEYNRVRPAWEIIVMIPAAMLILFLPLYAAYLSYRALLLALLLRTDRLASELVGSTKPVIRLLKRINAAALKEPHGLLAHPITYVSVKLLSKRIAALEEMGDFSTRSK